MRQLPFITRCSPILFNFFGCVAIFATACANFSLVGELPPSKCCLVANSVRFFRLCLDLRLNQACILHTNAIFAHPTL